MPRTLWPRVSEQVQQCVYRQSRLATLCSGQLYTRPPPTGAGGECQTGLWVQVVMRLGQGSQLQHGTAAANLCLSIRPTNTVT